MALIFSQESGESKNLSQVNSYTVTTEPGAIYRLADDATGTMPGDLKLSRQGNDLVLSSQSGNANVVMKGFWGGSEQSYLVLNLSGGEFVLTSEGLNLDAMSAGAEGTLADGTSIGLAGPTADKNDSIENSIDEPEKPTDTRIPGDTDNNGKLDNADDAGKPQVTFVDDRPALGQTSGDGILNRAEVGTDGKTTVQVDFPISGNYRGGDKVSVMVNGKPLLDNSGQPVVVTLEPVAPNDPGQGVKPITIEVPVNNDGPLKVEVEVRNPNTTLQDPPVVKSGGQVNVDTKGPVISGVTVEQHDTSDPADMTPEKTIVKFKGDDPTATYTVTGPNGEKAKVTGPDADGNYTAEFGPALPPDAAVTVKAVDPAGNEATGTGTVPGEVTHHAHDFNEPTLTITDNIDGDKANGDITFTIKPSEKITGLGQDDLKVTNGTIKSFTPREDGGADVVVTPTPATDGKVTLSVPEGAATAVVGGKPTAAASHEQGADTKAPTISDVTVEQHDTSDPADMTPEKTVVKFKGDDPAATYTVTGPNGEKATVTGPDSDGNYTAEFGPALPPNAAVTVKGVDPAGNEATGNGTVPAEVTHHAHDFASPTLMITDNIGGDKANGDITFTIKPSGRITGLTQDDLQVTNGTIKSFTPREDGGADVVVTPTPGTDGTVTLSVPEGAANAVVGGKPTAAASHEQGVDTKAPTISGVRVEQHDTSNAADMTPEKTVVKFKGDDPTATYTVTGSNGEKAKVTGPDADGNYTAEFGPALPPDAAVTVKAVDPAGNEATGNGTVPAEVTHHAHDFATPTLTITDNVDTDKANGDITFTIRPSEKISGLTQDDLQVTNGTIKSFTPREDGGADVVVTPTPGTDGKVTLNVPEGAANAVVGGKPTAAASHEQGVDTKAPTITGVTVEQHDTSDPADMTPEKTVVKFKGDDPTATYTVTDPNGEKAKVTGPDADGNYTAEFGPALPPNAAVTVKGVDPAGNEATGNGTVPAEVTHHAHDFATPTLTITDNVDAEKTNDDVTFTIKPSAKISGLGQDDLTVTNGTIKSFTPREDGGADVVVTPTPGTDGKITLNVPEGAATAVVGGKPTAAASHEQGTDTKGPVISDVTVEQRDTSDPADMTPEKTLVKFKGDDPDATYTAKAGDKVGTVVKQPDGSYVATFEPALPEGTVVTIEGTDVTGNKGTADSPSVPAEANTHDHEFATPTLTITDNIDGDEANGDITFTIKPSEKITGLTQDDLKVSNGTIKSFTPREDGGADVVVTPTSGTDGKVTLSVPEGAANAVVGGKPTAAASHEQGVDTKAPTISDVRVEQHDTSDPADMTPEKTVVKFKGDDPTATYTVTGPNGDKAKVTGPDADGNYTAEFGPALPPNAAVTVKAVDPAGNEATGNGTVPAEVTHHEHDFATPTLMITDNIDGDKANGDITFTIKPSEKITGLTQEHLSITNGTIKSFTPLEDGGADVMVTPTPGTDGKVTLSVAEGAANAVVGGKPTAAASHEQGVDTKAPTISDVTVEQHDTSDPADMTPENTIVKFNGDDPTATYTVTGPKGEKAKVTGPDADGNYTAEFGPALPPDAAVTVKAVDPAGNEATGNGTVPAEVTHHAHNFATPTLTITDNVDAEKTNGDVTFTITPSAKITGLTQEDLKVTNGTIKSFTPREDGGADVVVTPTAGTDGKVTLSVPEGAANAVVGGKPTAAASQEQGIDTKGPVISGVTVEQHDTSDPADMTPEKTIVKFKGDDPTATYTVTGPNGEKAKVSGPDADGNYTAEFGPALPPDAAVTVKAVDPAGNEATGNGTVPAEVTHHAHNFATPTLTITDNVDAEKTNGDVTFAITPSAKITGLGQDDLKVTNGTIKSFTPREDGGADVVVTPTPGTDGKVTLSVPEGAANAVVGGKPTAAASHEQGVDTKAPTISDVTVEQRDTSDPADMTPEKTIVKFKGDDPEATYTAKAGDKVGTVVKQPDGSYVATFEPALPEGTVVTIEGTDATSNKGTADSPAVPAEANTHDHDFATPTLTITDNVDAEKTNGDVTFTITPSAKITGLEQGDLNVANGTIKSFTQREDGGADVVVTPTPGTDGKVILSVPEGAANAVVGGKPTTAASHEQGVDTKAPTISDVTVEQHDTSNPADMTPEKTIVKFKGDDPAATYTVTGPKGEKAKVTGPDADGNYTAEFGPALSPNAAVTVKAVDPAGNEATGNGTVPAEVTHHAHEFAAPTLTVTDNIAANVTKDEITFTIKPSQPIRGLGVDDLTVANGTIKAGSFTNTADGGATVVVTPNANLDNQPVTLTVKANAANAVMGNKPTAQVSGSQVVDIKAPAITQVSVEQRDTSKPADMTPEKTLVKFKGDDPAATYTAKAGNKVGKVVKQPDGSYVATFEPALPAGTVVAIEGTDAVGNKGTAASPAVPAQANTHEHEFAAPTLTVTDNIAANVTKDEITFTIKPSQPIRGLGVDDLTVANGTIKAGSFTNTADGGATVVVTPNANLDNQPVTLTVKANAANAVMGNKPTAQVSGSQLVDTKAPAAPTVTANEDGTVLVRLPDANNAKPGDKVEVKVLPEGAVDGAAPTVVTLTKNADGSWTSDHPDTVPSVEAGKSDAVIPADKVKDHTEVSARAYDPVGNQSATSQDMAKSIPLRPLVLTLAEDTKGEGTAGTANDNITKNPTINVSNLVAGKAWEYSIDGGPWKDGSGSSFDLPSNSTPDGRLHKVKARIKGHPAETTSSELTVTLDQNVKAGTLMLDPGSNLMLSNVEAGAYYRITDSRGIEIAKGVANAQGMVTTNRKINAGTHTFKIHLTDKAGNLLGGKQVVEKVMTVGYMDQIYHPNSTVKKDTENWGASKVHAQIDNNPNANNVILVGKVAAGGTRQDGTGRIVAGTGGGLGKQVLDIKTYGGDDAIYASRLTATVGNREVNIDMGTGNDSLMIFGSGKEASTGYIAAHGGVPNRININMGDGDDYISSLSAGIADQSSISINMGRGNDLLHLKKESGGWSLNAIAGITSGRINIDMGADDDVVILEGRVFKFATIDGGSGYDKIYLGGKNEGTITGFEEISYSLPSGYSARGRFRRAADVDTEPSEKAALKLSDVLGGQSTSLVNGKEIKALFINGNGSLDIDKSENHQVEALNLSKGDTLYKEGYSTYYDKVEDVYVYVASTMSII